MTRAAKNQRAASTPTSSIRSSRVTNSPERLVMLTGLAVAHEADPRIEQDADRVAVMAHRLGGIYQAGHRPMVVLAPHVDQFVEATAELLDDIADVGSEVGGCAVGAVDHAILVIAELGRAEPRRIVLLVHVAGFAQGIHAALDPALVVDGALRLPNVEGDAQGARLRSMPARWISDAHLPYYPVGRIGVGRGVGSGHNFGRHLVPPFRRRRRPCSHPRAAPSQRGSP